jgi:hypothetical protein
MSELGNERISTEPWERANGALGKSDIEHVASKGMERMG